MTTNYTFEQHAALNNRMIETTIRDAEVSMEMLAVELDRAAEEVRKYKNRLHDASTNTVTPMNLIRWSIDPVRNVGGLKLMELATTAERLTELRTWKAAHEFFSAEAGMGGIDGTGGGVS